MLVRLIFVPNLINLCIHILNHSHCGIFNCHLCTYSHCGIFNCFIDLHLHILFPVIPIVAFSIASSIICILFGNHSHCHFQYPIVAFSIASSICICTSCLNHSHCGIFNCFIDLHLHILFLSIVAFSIASSICIAHLVLESFPLWHFQLLHQFGFVDLNLCQSIHS